MVIEAEIKAALESEEPHDGDTATLPLELTAIPGAVWQAELQSLMPDDVRVSLFQQGPRSCALLRFPPAQQERAYAAFERALRGANEVSRSAHSAAAKATQEARERARREEELGAAAATKP